MTSLTLITSLNDLSPNTVTFGGIVSTCELGVLVVQSCPRVTPWTAAHQASLSMEFSRQENWSGLPFLSPGDFPNPGIEPGSPALQAGATRELRARGNTVQSTATWNPWNLTQG